MLLKFQDFSSSTFSWIAAGPWRLVCGSDNAVTGRLRSSAQGAKKTQYRKLRGEARHGRNKQCLLYSSQFLRTHTKCCSPLLSTVKTKRVII